MARTPASLVSPLNVLHSEVPEVAKPRPNNTVHIVVAKKITKEDLEQRTSHENLIQLTEKLAEEAKNGTLKGLGGFALYDDGYVFGLEGSYLLDPSSAILPLERLKHQVMVQLED